MFWQLFRLVMRWRRTAEMQWSRRITRVHVMIGMQFAIISTSRKWLKQSSLTSEYRAEVANMLLFNSNCKIQTKWVMMVFIGQSEDDTKHLKYLPMSPVFTGDNTTFGRVRPYWRRVILWLSPCCYEYAYHAFIQGIYRLLISRAAESC